jgi:putative flippase GtrA
MDMGKKKEILMALFDLLIKKTDDTRLQFLRYIGVGGFAAIINIGSLILFKTVFGFYYLVANVFAFLLGLIANYILSKILIFTSPINVHKTFEFLIIALISAVGLGLDTFFLWSFTHILGMFYLISKIISTGIVFVWNFSARKVFYRFDNLKKGNITTTGDVECQKLL